MRGMCGGFQSQSLLIRSRQERSLNAHHVSCLATYSTFMRYKRAQDRFNLVASSGHGDGEVSTNPSLSSAEWEDWADAPDTPVIEQAQVQVLGKGDIEEISLRSSLAELVSSLRGEDGVVSRHMCTSV